MASRNPRPTTVVLIHCSAELSLLIIASIIYYCITRLAWSKVIVPAPSSSYSGRPASPRSSEVRRGAPLITTSLNKKEERGLLWMTVPKNYRYVR